MTIIRAARATSPRSRTECCTAIRLLDLNALTFPIGASRLASQYFSERRHCVAHVSGPLDWRRANQALFVIHPGHYPESIKARVIALRDECERIFVRS
jgi:hypothetical protein